MKMLTVCLMMVSLIFSPLLLTSAKAQHTIWVSPLNFKTADSDISISPGSPDESIRVSSSATGDLQWVVTGLTIPGNVKIDSLTLYYELNDPNSFISQIRLTQMTTPDAATVYHDDPTDLTNIGPTGYTSMVSPAISPIGAVSLNLRLNFGSTADWIDIGGIAVHVSPVVTKINEGNTLQAPQTSSLEQNYPNPFNPSTNIAYEVQESGHVQLRIYNTLGQLVRTVVDENKKAGRYEVRWDGKDNYGRDLPSGNYFYQLRVNDFAGAKRMIKLK